MSNSTLAVAGQEITVTAVPTARDFINTKFNLSIAKPVKGVKSDSLKVQALALGVTAEQFKAVSAELKSMQSAHFVKSRQVVSLLVSDPNIRTSVRQSFRKKDGVCIGATATFRKEPSKSMSQANIIAALQAELAQLRGIPAVTA